LVTRLTINRSAPSSGLGVRPSSGSRLPGIEGLRAIAACSILVYHTWLFSPPGPRSANLGVLDGFMLDLAYGVVLFFTLSGFLLYRPFAAAILRGRPLPSLRRYLRNRALRILPAYWVILFLCAIVLGSALFWDSSGNLADGRLLDVGALARAGLFLQGYFPSTLLVGIGPAWSLAVEVVFYCALPLLVVLAVALARRCTTRAGRRWVVLVPAALILMVGLTGKLAAAHLVPPASPFDDWAQNWHSVLVRSFWCQADLFAFGMALAVLRVDSEDGLLRLPRWWRKAAVIGVLAAYAAVARAGDGQQLSYSPRNTVVAAACALLLALVVLPADGAATSALVRVLETRPLVAAGVISYSIFLWHEPLIRWLDAHSLTLAGRGGLLVNLIMAAVATGVASTLTYRLVEAPALRLRFRRTARAAEPVPMAQVEAAP
jgi:peptidoglycan/LPS O-acetylase OafA/YrhL